MHFSIFFSISVVFKIVLKMVRHVDQLWLFDPVLLMGSVEFFLGGLDSTDNGQIDLLYTVTYDLRPMLKMVRHHHKHRPNIIISVCVDSSALIQRSSQDRLRMVSSNLRRRERILYFHVERAAWLLTTT